MAARTRRGTKDSPWTENVRQRIRGAMLAKRLEDHALGIIQMKATEVQAALGLLKKVAPDLAATELSGEVARPTVIRAPATVSDSRSWLDQYGPDVGKVRGSDEPKPN